MGQLLVSGLAIGCIYALGSLGYVITYKSVAILNFAYGEIMTFGAYLAATFIVGLGMPVLPGILLVLLAMAVIGVVFAYAVY